MIYLLVFYFRKSHVNQFQNRAESCHSVGPPSYYNVIIIIVLRVSNNIPDVLISLPPWPYSQSNISLKCHLTVDYQWKFLCSVYLSLNTTLGDVMSDSIMFIFLPNCSPGNRRVVTDLLRPTAANILPGRMKRVETEHSTQSYSSTRIQQKKTCLLQTTQNII